MRFGMLQGNRIVRNLFFVSSGEVVSKFLMFITFVYVARVLGPENFGKWGFVFSLVSFFYITSSIGLDVFGAREIAKNKKNSSSILNQVLSIKMVLGLINYMVLLGALFLLPHGNDVKILIAVYGLSIFSNSLLVEFYFQGRENMKHLGIGKVLRALTLVILAMIFVQKREDILKLAIVYVIAHFTTNIYLFIITFKNSRFKFTLKKWKPYLSISLILGLTTFLSYVNFQVDQILLAFMDVFENLGIYNAAVKVIYLTMITSGILWLVFMPAIAKAINKKSDFSFLFRNYVRITLFIGFFFFGLTFFFSEGIIELLYGAKYVLAADVLSIISFAVVFQFLNAIFVSPLYVMGKEKRYFFSVMSGAVVNVILNLLLIPRYGIFGAAYATVISYAIISLAGFLFIRREIDMNFLIFIKYVFVIVLCYSILRLVQLNIILEGIIFVVSYLILLFVLKEIEYKDFEYLRKVVQR
jgi:O-antigen/teichoic acid export membrane protein